MRVLGFFSRGQKASLSYQGLEMQKLGKKKKKESGQVSDPQVIIIDQRRRQVIIGIFSHSNKKIKYHPGFSDHKRTH